MEMINLIPSDLIVLVIALNVLGFGVSKYQNFNNKYIPLLLLIFGCVFSCWIRMGITAESVLQGILCWGTSIGFNQVYKQLKDK